jgi:hypothetical protein
MVLGHRHLPGRSAGPQRRHIDEAPDIVSVGSERNVQGSAGVDLMRVVRLIGAGPGAGRRHVDDQIGVGHPPVHGVGITDIGLDDLDRARRSAPVRVSGAEVPLEVVERARGRIVDDDDAVPERHERVDNVAPDEAGTTGDDHPSVFEFHP